MSAKSLIASLESELLAMWSAPEDPSGPPVSRVCTMNLVVVAGSRELADRYTPVVDEVTASIPARAIVVSVEPNAADHALGGSATAVCSPGPGAKVCSERVLLSARGDASARVASAVEALLVPEIPTVLVWLGRVHTDDPIFETLARDATRVITDSEYTSLSSLLQLSAWARRTTGGPHVADLAWTRLGPWQELAARFFDPTEARSHATRIERVRLSQTAGQPTRLGPEPVLFLGWLATRLGWKTTRLGGALRFARPDGAAVSLEIDTVGRPELVAPNALAAVILEADDPSSGPLAGSVVRDLEGDPDVVVWTQATRGKPSIEQRIRLGGDRAGRWLEATLHRPPGDPAFVESVAFAEQIVEDGLAFASAEGRLP